MYRAVLAKNFSLSKNSRRCMIYSMVKKLYLFCQLVCVYFDHLKMAESVREETISNNLPSGGHLTKLECAVCLQTCVHPAELPCGHIFCYLCIKGIVNQGRRCAMCRQDIPLDYLDKPTLLNPVDAEITSQGFEDGHLWFYEGHNGWWQYDERTSLELESAYQKGERCCDLLIAGFLYVADFDGMLQYRRNDPSRRRRIKRDLATTTKKGIAGLKPTKNCNLTSLNSPEVVSNNMIQNLPVSNSSVLNNLSGIRMFTSGTNISNQHLDRVASPHRPRGISTDCSLPSCRPPSVTNSITVSQTESSITNSTNLNFDSAIHETLDWTIEQIESLNLELLNDYETLFRDVNSYGQLQHSLEERQFRRSPNNYMSRYLNLRNPTSGFLANDLVPTNAVPDSSYISSSHNLQLGRPPVPSEEAEPIYSEVAESTSDTSLPSVEQVPQPPPRSRGMSRSRSRIDSLRHLSNLNGDSLLQRFISNK